MTQDQSVADLRNGRRHHSPLSDADINTITSNMTVFFPSSAAAVRSMWDVMENQRLRIELMARQLRQTEAHAFCAVAFGMVLTFVIGYWMGGSK